MKKGDMVRNKHSGSLGKVLMIDPPGMRGFVLVEFTPGSDGLCIPPSQLEAVSVRNMAKQAVESNKAFRMWKDGQKKEAPKQRLRELDRGTAQGLIEGCERDLRRKLSRGEMRDLLKDRTKWSSAKVTDVVAQLYPERAGL